MQTISQGALRSKEMEPLFNERISAALSMKVVSNKYLLKNEG